MQSVIGRMFNCFYRSETSTNCVNKSMFLELCSFKPHWLSLCTRSSKTLAGILALCAAFKFSTVWNNEDHHMVSTQEILLRAVVLLILCHWFVNYWASSLLQLEVAYHSISRFIWLPQSMKGLPLAELAEGSRNPSLLVLAQMEEVKWHLF